jgi:hypothetical protein
MRPCIHVTWSLILWFSKLLLLVQLRISRLTRALCSVACAADGDRRRTIKIIQTEFGVVRVSKMTILGLAMAMSEEEQKLGLRRSYSLCILFAWKQLQLNSLTILGYERRYSSLHRVRGEASDTVERVDVLFRAVGRGPTTYTARKKTAHRTIKATKHIA